MAAGWSTVIAASVTSCGIGVCIGCSLATDAGTDADTTTRPLFRRIAAIVGHVAPRLQRSAAVGDDAAEAATKSPAAPTSTMKLEFETVCDANDSSSEDVGLELATHDRYTYSAITQRSDYSWPGGKRLAVYFAINLEHFEFGKGMGAKLGGQCVFQPGHPCSTLGLP